MSKLPKVTFNFKYNEQEDIIDSLFQIGSEIMHKYEHCLMDDETLNEITCLFTTRIKELRYNLQNQNNPLLIHDCSGCTYLGQYLYCNFVSNQILSVCYFDLYYHERGNRVEFIARYGNEPKEYLSFTYFKNIPQNPEEYFPQQQLKIMDEIYKRYMAKKEMV